MLGIYTDSKAFSSGSKTSYLNREKSRANSYRRIYSKIIYIFFIFLFRRVIFNTYEIVYNIARSIFFNRFEFVKNVNCFFRIKNHILRITNIVFYNDIIFTFKIRSKFRTRGSVNNSICNSYSFCTSDIIMRFKFTRSFANHNTFKNSVGNILKIISIGCIFVRSKNGFLDFEIFPTFFSVYKKGYNISCFFAGKRYVKFSTPERVIFSKETHTFCLIKIRLSPITTFRNIIRVKFAKSLHIRVNKCYVHIFKISFRKRIIAGFVFFKKRHNNYLDKFINSY